MKNLEFSQKEKEALAAKTNENCRAHIDKLRELFKTYDVAKLGYEMQQKMSREIYNETLKKESFFADMECERAGIKKGDRITDEDLMFLLSDEDTDKLFELSRPLFVKNHITDDDGNYITDWLTIMCNARRALVLFIIENIVPEGLKEEFSIEKMNVVHQAKLMELFRPILNEEKLKHIEEIRQNGKINPIKIFRI